MSLELGDAHVCIAQVVILSGTDLLLEYEPLWLTGRTGLLFRDLER